MFVQCRYEFVFETPAACRSARLAVMERHLFEIKDIMNSSIVFARDHGQTVRKASKALLADPVHRARLQHMLRLHRLVVFETMLDTEYTTLVEMTPISEEDLNRKKTIEQLDMEAMRIERDMGVDRRNAPPKPATAAEIRRTLQQDFPQPPPPKPNSNAGAQREQQQREQSRRQAAAAASDDDDEDEDEDEDEEEERERAARNKKQQRRSRSKAATKKPVRRKRPAKDEL